MFIRPTTLALAGALTATGLSAQILHEQTTSILEQEYWYFIHDAIGGLPADFEYIACFPQADAIGWGFTSANPGSHTINGVSVILNDSNPATANSIWIYVMGESTQFPGEPDYAGAAAFGPIATPTGQATYVLDVGFAVPVLRPVTGDVFISVELLPETVADQLRLASVRNDSLGGGITTFDVPNSRTAATGHGFGTQGGFAFLIDWSVPAAFFDYEQYAITPLGTQPQFATLAVTNQVSYPDSNPAGTPGYTSSLFSGRQPALLTSRTGAARADDIGVMYFNGNLTNAEPIGFMFGAPAASPFDLSLLFPGSAGTLCLTGALPLGATMTLDPTGFAKLIVAIPAGSRAGLIGQDLWFTGIALDFLNGRVAAGSCNVISL